MFWTHFKAIFYRNLLIHSDSIPFFLLIMILLTLVKMYFKISYEIYFFLSMLIIIYIFQRNLILNFIEDKILKFRSLFSVAGMSDFNYILAQVLSNFILMFFLVCFGYTFVIAQRNFEVSILELQFLGITVLFAFSLITFNLFMSLFFKNPLLAADISNMITFVLNLVAMILTLMDSPFVNLVRIIPNTPYYIMVKAIVIDAKTTTFMTVLPDIILLVFLMFFYLFLYYRLDSVMGDDNGMNKGLWDYIKESFKKEETVEEEIEISRKDQTFQLKKQQTENLSVISEEPRDDQIFSDSKPILQLNNVCKSFVNNNNFSIKDLNMEFRRGEICCLIGSNGAGKSTLLNLISGIYKKDKGQINIYDKHGEIDKSPKIGFCSSENLLFDILTVQQHFKFYFALHGVSDYNEKMDYLMEIFNITQYRDFRASALSGGNRRKLCVAISFIGNPELILLDEPSSSLDPFSKKEMFKILTELNRNKKCTIILTSHDFQEIQTFHKDICMLKLGNVISRGNLKTIKDYFGVGCTISISKKSFADKPDIVQKIKTKLEELEKNLKENSLKNLSIKDMESKMRINIAGTSKDLDNVIENTDEEIKKAFESHNLMKQNIEIKYNVKGELIIEVPNIISDKLQPIYETLNELLGSDIEISITNGLDIQKILHQQEQTDLDIVEDFSMEMENVSENTVTTNNDDNKSIGLSSMAYNSLNDCLSEKNGKFYRSNNNKELREKILKGMDMKYRSNFFTRIKIIFALRYKFLFANAVELTTLIIVTGITTLCGCYAFLASETIFPFVPMDELAYYTVLLLLITEGYNNILYSYHMVYENSYSIKKLLICNGLQIHEYYIAHMLADFSISVIMMTPLFLGISITMRVLIMDKFLSDYQIFLFCLTLMMWKLSFIVINYFYSFIFVRTSFVTRNFCVLYLVISGLCLVLSNYIPMIYYFNDFVFCLKTFEQFQTIDLEVMRILTVPIFQIVFFFILILIYEHHSITHNYISHYKEKKNSETIKKNRLDQLKVKIQNLKKIYSGSKPSLNLSSLKLTKKDCIGLIGPNGAGKSTFFNVLISEIKKSGGQIRFGDYLNDSPFSHYNFAVCLQKNSLWVELTVKDHFDFYCKLIGLNDKEYVASLIKYFELNEFMNMCIFQLTDGNMRKVCIALSLLRRPDFILYDEATTGIDIINCHNIQMLIKDIQKKFGSIMILTTHIMREVEYLCQTIGVLYDGEFALHDKISQTKKVFTKSILKLIVNEDIFDEEEFAKTLSSFCEIQKKKESTDSSKIFEILSFKENKTILQILQIIDEMKNNKILKDYDISSKTLEDIFIELIRKQKNYVSAHPQIENSEFHLETRISLSQPKFSNSLNASQVYQKLENLGQYSAIFAKDDQPEPDTKTDADDHDLKIDLIQ